MAIDVEEAIQEAQRDGRFSNLPGRGQPLHIDPSPDAVVNNLLKEAHVRPEWIEVGCLIDELQARTTRYLNQFRRQYENEWQELTAPSHKTPPLSGWRRWWHILWQGSENRLHTHGDSLTRFNRRVNVALSRYASLLHETNRKIRRFNGLVPQRELQRNLLPVRDLLEEFATQFPLAAPHSEQNIVPKPLEVPSHLFGVENRASRSASYKGLK